MPNGETINERLEFTERIKHMSPDDRSIAVAEMVYDLNVKVESYIGAGYSRKGSIISSASIAAIIVGIFEGLKTLFVR